MVQHYIPRVYRAHQSYAALESSILTTLLNCQQVTALQALPIMIKAVKNSEERAQWDNKCLLILSPIASQKLLSICTF
ncbi:hypothetical protein TNCV_150871 [Trichonephila clavipes]|nr:hypothetical protein TNCV_150871 [Trichonephila clavipes]